MTLAVIVLLAVTVVALLCAVAELAKSANSSATAAKASARDAEEARQEAALLAERNGRLQDLLTTSVGPSMRLTGWHIDTPTRALPTIPTAGVARHRLPVNGFAPGAPLPEDTDGSAT